MDKYNETLPFMLRRENVAWFEDGKVRMLDRRVYPFQISFVECTTYQEVAQAMRDMVTQSAGTYLTAAMGMALAAYQCAGLSEKKQRETVKKAAKLFCDARPTSRTRIEQITEGTYQVFEKALQEGKNTSEEIKKFSLFAHETRHRKMKTLAKYFVDMLPPHQPKVLIQNFGDTVFAMMLEEAKERNCDLKLYCTEVRPFLQGARLAASIAKEMDVDVTVITDNMSPYLIDHENIEICASSADIICMDGHVVNKIGTYQMAIIADYMRLPYYVCGAPDKGNPTVDTVEIETRDPKYMFEFEQEKWVLEGVKGYYPVYDITPPRLVSGIVTDCGVYSPYDLKHYAGTGVVGEYQVYF